MLGRRQEGDVERKRLEPSRLSKARQFERSHPTFRPPVHQREEPKRQRPDRCRILQRSRPRQMLCPCPSASTSRAALSSSASATSSGCARMRARAPRRLWDSSASCPPSPCGLLVSRLLRVSAVHAPYQVPARRARPPTGARRLQPRPVRHADPRRPALGRHVQRAQRRVRRRRVRAHLRPRRVLCHVWRRRLLRAQRVRRRVRRVGASRCPLGRTRVRRLPREARRARAAAPRTLARPARAAEGIRGRHGLVRPTPRPGARRRADRCGAAHVPAGEQAGPHRAADGRCAGEAVRRRAGAARRAGAHRPGGAAARRAGERLEHRPAAQPARLRRGSRARVRGPCASRAACPAVRRRGASARLPAVRRAARADARSAGRDDAPRQGRPARLRLRLRLRGCAAPPPLSPCPGARGKACGRTRALGPRRKRR